MDANTLMAIIYLFFFVGGVGGGGVAGLEINLNSKSLKEYTGFNGKCYSQLCTNKITTVDRKC